MKRYYPIFLDLSGKNVRVVGGGKVAQRKIAALLKLGVKIFVTSIQFDPKILGLAREKKISIVKRGFKAADLKNMDLVFCATNDSKINLQVSRECQKRGIWVNVADQPALCSFIVPSIVRRGEVAIAVSTGGASPALAKFLRKKIEKAVGPQFGVAAKTLKKFRKKIVKIPLTRRRKMISKILEELNHGND